MGEIVHEVGERRGIGNLDNSWAAAGVIFEGDGKHVGVVDVEDRQLFFEIYIEHDVIFEMKYV